MPVRKYKGGEENEWRKKNVDYEPADTKANWLFKPISDSQERNWALEEQ